jgi:hypothetical protein
LLGIVTAPYLLRSLDLAGRSLSPFFQKPVSANDDLPGLIKPNYPDGPGLELEQSFGLLPFKHPRHLDILWWADLGSPLQQIQHRTEVGVPRLDEVLEKSFQWALRLFILPAADFEGCSTIEALDRHPDSSTGERFSLTQDDDMKSIGWQPIFLHASTFILQESDPMGKVFVPPPRQSLPRPVRQNNSRRGRVPPGPPASFGRSWQRGRVAAKSH